MGHYLVNENNGTFDFVKSGECASDMEPVNSHARRRFRSSLSPLFSGERIIFKGFQVGFDDPYALVSLKIDESDRIDIDADLKRHFLISESGTYLFRFLMRPVSSISRVSESLLMRFPMASS